MHLIAFYRGERRDVGSWRGLRSNLCNGANEICDHGSKSWRGVNANTCDYLKPPKMNMYSRFDIYDYISSSGQLVPSQVLHVLVVFVLNSVCLCQCNTNFTGSYGSTLPLLPSSYAHWKQQLCLLHTQLALASPSFNSKTKNHCQFFPQYRGPAVPYLRP